MYDSSHMGHARTYLSLDIMRRIMEDYFGYDMFVVMNITDIDDKIILKARQNHLLASYAAEHASLTAEVRAELVTAIEAEVARHEAASAAARDNAKLTDAERSATVAMFDGKRDASRAVLADVRAAAADSPLAELLERVSAPLAVHLDRLRGATVDIQTLFREHAARYEAEYLEDMAALGVRPVDVMTRVSEYLDEVVEMVERIIANGFAYESDGSVYFDTQAFAASPDHSYGKLEPWSVGDAGLLADGEGALTGPSAKRHPNDFALVRLL